MALSCFASVLAAGDRFFVVLVTFSKYWFFLILGGFWQQLGNRGIQSLHFTTGELFELEFGLFG